MEVGLPSLLQETCQSLQNLLYLIETSSLSPTVLSSIPLPPPSVCMVGDGTGKRRGSQERSENQKGDGELASLIFKNCFIICVYECFAYVLHVY